MDDDLIHASIASYFKKMFWQLRKKSNQYVWNRERRERGEREREREREREYLPRQLTGFVGWLSRGETRGRVGQYTPSILINGPLHIIELVT